MDEKKDYIKAIAESAYKKAVHNKVSTSSDLAFFEESNYSEAHTSIEAIWLDSDIIPSEPPLASELLSDIYYADRGNVRIALLQKVNGLPLQQLRGTDASFTHELLRDALPQYYRDGYIFEIRDSNGDEIPFGLNKWVLDADGGILSFLDGFPQGYEKEIYVSFWRYIGRKGNEGLLTSAGDVAMRDDYIPQTDKQVTTKDYVDSLVGDLGGIVDKLCPPEPPTFDGAELRLLADNIRHGALVVSNDEMDYIEEGADFSIDIPSVFWNEDRGTISLYCNDGLIDSFEPNKDIADGASFGHIVVERNEDYYKNELASRGFFNGLKIRADFNESELRSLYIERTPVLNFYFVFEFPFMGRTYKTRAMNVGVAKPLENPSIGNIRLLASSDGRMVSGVPSMGEGYSFEVVYDSHSVVAIKDADPFVIAETDCEETGTTYEDLANAVYTSINPTHSTAVPFVTPSDFCSNGLTFKMRAYGLGREEVADAVFSMPVLFDSKSDESLRVVSGIGEEPADFGGAYDSSADLRNSNELMLLGGRYQYPKGDWTKLGVLPLGVVSVWSAGPDYSKVDDGIRYATFAFDLPYCNSVDISLDEPENIEQTDGTFAPKNFTLQYIVQGWTSWISVGKPYLGVGVNPRSNAVGSLVVHSSGVNKWNVTFGDSPLHGKIFIRVGVDKESGISFSGVKVTPKI